MKAFAALYASIDETNKTNEKVSSIARYLQHAPPEDAAWAVHFLVGRRPKRLVGSTKLSAWAVEASGLPDWLFWESYDAVGDLAETIAAVLPEATAAHSAHGQDSLAWWVENRLLALAGMEDEEQRQLLRQSWSELDQPGRFAFNKLITGAFRVGVSQDLVTRALSEASGVPRAVLAHRLMGDWQPTGPFYERLVGDEDSDSSVSRPYPFCLAHQLDGEPAQLGDISAWHAEWKWDGIRAQLIRREGQSFVWSRGEELMTERFPEITALCDALPDGTVIDGELLGWSGGLPLTFLELQKRIGRKVVGKKIMSDVPVVLVAFDALEIGGRDVRSRPFSERRKELEKLVAEVGTNLRKTMPIGDEVQVDPRLLPRPGRKKVESHPRLLLATQIHARTWDELAAIRATSRELQVEGVMLKRVDSLYAVGRKKGVWWKWKIEPFTVDAVLIYANRGSGKRASLYTDYTFGVWHEGSLVPFAKAYSGLSDEEIRKVDAWVRRNTVEKFGPVRTVKPELVFELAFEGIQLSNRHKSGVAVRFPRISRWRHDKRAEDADHLQEIKESLKSHLRTGLSAT